MCAALHAAGVYQHMRALNMSASGLMRQSAQPAVAWAGRSRVLRESGQCRVERGTNVVKMNRIPGREHPSGCKQGLWRLFFAQVADHHRPEKTR